MKFTKSFIMKRAWMIAKAASQVLGGKAKIYFSGSLKMSWEFAKKASLSSNFMKEHKALFDKWFRSIYSTPKVDWNSFIVLGLPTVATKQQVKQAYKRLAFVNHPDKGGNHHTFIHVKTAYEQCMKHLSFH